MQINFANSAGSIVVHHTVNGLTLRAGKLNLLDVGGEFKNSQLISTNVIKTINLGSFRGGSIIKSQGSNGRIENINVKKSLNGTIDVSGDVNTIKVGTDLGSPHIRINGNLRTLNVLGSIVTGVYRGFVVPPGIPPAITSHARDSLSAAVHAAETLPADQSEALLTAAKDAFTNGLAIASGVGSALMLISAVAVWILLRARLPGEPEVGVLHDPGVHRDACGDAGVDAARGTELGDRHC